MARFTLTADGQTEVFDGYTSFRVHAEGTFGGGTLTIEEDIRNDGNFVTIDDSAKQEDADFIMDGLTRGKYRFDLSGATTPSIEITVKAQ